MIELILQSFFDITFLYLLLYSIRVKSIFFIFLGIILFLTFVFFKKKSIKQSLVSLVNAPIQLAFIVGSYMNRWRILPGFIKSHALLIAIILAYIITTIYFIDYGIPNNNHPFTYNMDEWHFSQGLRFTFHYGTPNSMGAAHGALFYYVLTGVFVGFFTLAGLTNPLTIKTLITQLDAQHRFFEILRFSTLSYGIFAIIFVALISKKLKLPSVFLSALFAASPIFVTLSAYFKYDIAVLCWILFSLYCILHYAKKQSSTAYILTGIVCALTIGTKLTALPIFLIYLFSFFLFTKNYRKRLHILFAGFFVFCATLFIYGIPDIFGKYQVYYDLLHVNVTATPTLRLGSDWLIFLLVKEFPLLFGHFLYTLCIVSFLYICIKYVINYLRFAQSPKVTINKNEVFFLVSFLFFTISLFPLKLGAGSMRAIVLLPFIIFISGFALQNFRKAFPKVYPYIGIIIFIGILFQTFESFAWLSIKSREDIRDSSSLWLVKYIPQKTFIGIENIPIYQGLPNLILKEFYVQQYYLKKPTTFRYEVIDKSTTVLPSVIVVSDADFARIYDPQSSKALLIQHLERLQYKKIAVFTSNFFWYNKIGDPVTFTAASLIPVPTSIGIYEKQM